MKFFWNRIFQALFGWSLVLPSKAEPAKPFEGKITSTESDDEVWIEPLEIAEDSILRQTDPLLMTRKECHESTVRYWMERKGYSKEEIAKPLTDDRLKEIGRVTFKEHYQAQERNRRVVKADPRFEGYVLPIADAREVE
jgi:hypothetical protein